MEFDIQKYKSGKYIATTKGAYNNVRILCTDRKAKECVVALVKNNDGFEHLYTYLPNGRLFSDAETPLDLILLER